MNLWADFDNNHQSAQQVVGRTRRLTEQTITATVRQWLLNDYAAPYCRALGATRIFRRCYWIDALGIDASASVPLKSDNGESQVRTGKGRKKELTQNTPPILQPIVSLSQVLAQESKPITLYGLIVEAGSGKRKEEKMARNGTAALAPKLVLPKESGIIHAGWPEIAPTLLTEIDQAPGIFLLNPLGHTPFRYEDLSPLYQRTVPTEILLLISHKQVTMRLLAVQRTPTIAAAFTALLRSDRWKTLSTNEEEVEASVNGVLDLFVSSMQRSFSLPVQRIRLPIQVRPAVVEEIPYTLLFATKRQDSFVCMNDAVCLYRRRVLEQSHHGVLAEEWFLAQQQERLAEERQQLYQSTLQQGKAKRIRRWPDLRQQLLSAHFGQYMQHEYDAVIEQLLAVGAVRCEWRRKIVLEESTQRIPGNDDTLLWV